MEFKFNVPNKITIIRVLLIPLFAFVLVANIRYRNLFAAFIFAMLSVSDFLDGYFAKRFSAATKLGSLLDPLCDKLFSVTCFSLLMVFGLCPSWFVALHVAIILLQFVGLWILKVPLSGPRSAFSPLRVGKWNTLIQFAWMGVLFADLALKPFNISVIGLNIGFLLLAMIQITVFLRYFFRSRLLLAHLFSISSKQFLRTPLPKTA